MIKKTYLITGGAGFIGSRLINRLLISEEDSIIINVDNFDPLYSEKIKQENLTLHRKFSNCKMYVLDINDYESLRKVFEVNRITHIIHLAGKSGNRSSLLFPEEYFETNIKGTVNLLNLAKQFKVPKFVFASTSSVYGMQDKTPFKEDMNISSPISLYAATKAACEQACYTYSHLYGINIICLRFFNVYGPGQRPDLAIHKFTQILAEGKTIPVFGDGTSIRDYVYIDDIIQGIIAAINYEKSDFEIFNLGTSKTVKIIDLIALIEENLGKKAVIEKRFLQPCDIPVSYADISKAKEILGYNPTVDIDSGIKKFVFWFKEFYNFSPVC